MEDSKSSTYRTEPEPEEAAIALIAAVVKQYNELSADGRAGFALGAKAHFSLSNEHWRIFKIAIRACYPETKPKGRPRGSKNAPKQGGE